MLLAGAPSIAVCIVRALSAKYPECRASVALALKTNGLPPIAVSQNKAWNARRREQDGQIVPLAHRARTRRAPRGDGSARARSRLERPLSCASRSGADPCVADSGA